MSLRFLARSKEAREAGAAHKPARTGRGGTLDRTELRYILIEILIVATGVFVALLVDEVRQAADHRITARETRAALRAEAMHNRSDMARKLYMLHSAAQTLARQPERAAELVEAHQNNISRPRDTAWTIATQSDAIRLLTPNERERITDVYAAEGVYVDLVKDEMTAWTQLAATAGGGATRREARTREQAIRVWRAYAGRVALAACIAAVRIERQLYATLPENAGAQVCPAYRIDDDPAVIYRTLRVPQPPLQAITG